MYLRHLEPLIEEALLDTPVVLLRGGRQTGKSTLVRGLAGRHPGALYRSLDDLAVLGAAVADPVGFIKPEPGLQIIDEVQRALNLILPVKAEVDRLRLPGRYLLTGSADVMVLPKLADTLAGRMEILTLWPLAQGEVRGVVEGFVDWLFGPDQPAGRLPALPTDELLAEIVCGGYPEARARRTAHRRDSWFQSYLATVVEKEIRGLANVEGLTALPALLSILASRGCGLLNQADLSRVTGIAQTTLQRYLALFSATFVVRLVPAWARNAEKRLTRSPKVLMTDTGLMAYLLGVGEDALAGDRRHLGPLLETFVGMELLKQSAWSRVRPGLFHFRTHKGHEVDYVLEARGGRIAGVEVKAGATPTASDFRGLYALREAAGDAFVKGVVFHTGSELLRFGENLFAVPVQALWSLGARPIG